MTLDDVAPPSWFSYVDGRFSITDQSVEGVYKVTVVVSDGFLTQSNDFTLTLVENTGIILPAVDASSDLTALVFKNTLSGVDGQLVGIEGVVLLFSSSGTVGWIYGCC